MTILETERLLIRKWDIEGDLDDAFVIYGDEETMRFIPGGVRDRDGTRETLKRMVQRAESEGFGIWPVVHKADGRVIGACGVFHIPDHAPDVEIAWVFSKHYRGRGYATEAAGAVAEYAIAHYRLPVLYALIHEDNTPSIRLAERLGMKHTKMIFAYERELGLYERRGVAAKAT